MPRRRRRFTMSSLGRVPGTLPDPVRPVGRPQRRAPGRHSECSASGRPLLVELLLVALPGPGLRAEAALEAAGRDPRRRAAGLGIAGAAAVRGVIAVAAGVRALGLPLLLGEVRRPRRVADPLLLVAAGELEELIERAGPLVDVGGGVAQR